MGFTQPEQVASTRDSDNTLAPVSISVKYNLSDLNYQINIGGYLSTNYYSVQPLFESKGLLAIGRPASPSRYACSSIV
jgi:hypothetical protein